MSTVIGENRAKAGPAAGGEAAEAQAVAPVLRV